METGPRPSLDRIHPLLNNHARRTRTLLGRSVQSLSFHMLSLLLTLSSSRSLLHTHTP